MGRVENGTIIRFSILDGLYWAYYAAFVGFITTYLLACGMKSTELSIVLAVFMALSFIGAFFWGNKCDQAKTNKKIFIPQFIAAFAVSMVIYFMADINILVSAVLYPVFGFLSSSLGSNLDTWMLRSFYKDAATYGRARAIGSAGYAVTALLVGQLISLFGYTMIPVCAAVLAVLVLFLASATKELPYGDQPAYLKAEKINPLALTKISSYMFLIVILFLTGLAVSPVNNLKIVILESVGGDVGILGIDSFLGVMVQAVFIFISGNLKKIPVYFRLFLMSACVMITMLLIWNAQASWMVILGTVFNNMSYGIMLPTQREITESTVTPELKNTAHSLGDATFGSFSGVLALLYSGVMMDTLGARSVAVLGTGIMVIPVCLSLYAVIKNRKSARP